MVAPVRARTTSAANTSRAAYYESRGPGRQPADADAIVCLRATCRPDCSCLDTSASAGGPIRAPAKAAPRTTLTPAGRPPCAHPEAEPHGGSPPGADVGARRHAGLTDRNGSGCGLVDLQRFRASSTPVPAEKQMDPESMAPRRGLRDLSRTVLRAVGPRRARQHRDHWKLADVPRRHRRRSGSCPPPPPPLDGRIEGRIACFRIDLAPASACLNPEEGKRSSKEQAPAEEDHTICICAPPARTAAASTSHFVMAGRESTEPRARTYDGKFVVTSDDAA